MRQHESGSKRLGDLLRDRYFLLASIMCPPPDTLRLAHEVADWEPAGKFPGAVPKADF